MNIFYNIVSDIDVVYRLIFGFLEGSEDHRAQEIVKKSISALEEMISSDMPANKLESIADLMVRLAKIPKLLDFKVLVSLYKKIISVKNYNPLDDKFIKFIVSNVSEQKRVHLFYALMPMLQDESVHSKHNKLKIDAITKVSIQLLESSSQGEDLNEKYDTSSKKIDVLQCMVAAISNVAARNDSASLENIVALVKTYINKCHDETIAAQLSLEIQKPGFNGKTYFHCLVNAFAGFVKRNKISSAGGFATLMRMLIEKLKASVGFFQSIYSLTSALRSASYDQQVELVKKISQFINMLLVDAEFKGEDSILKSVKRKDHESDVNVFYNLVASLQNAAASKNTVILKELLKLITLFIEKSSPYYLVRCLRINAEKNVEWSQVTGFYFLFDALANTVSHPLSICGGEILDIASKLLGVCDSNTLISELFVVKRSSVPFFPDKTAFSRLIDAFKNAEGEVRGDVANLIVSLLMKVSESDLSVFRPYLLKYYADLKLVIKIASGLSGEEDFRINLQKQLSDRSTFLSNVVDYHRNQRWDSFFNKMNKDTGTRASLEKEFKPTAAL